jgi:hypothetical protein
MKKLGWLWWIAVVMWPLTGAAKDASLSMIYTTALQDELPYAIFTKGSWSPDPKARFVKLHLYFDEPIKIKGLEIDSCGTKLKPDLSIFFNFDQWILRLDPKLSGEIPQAHYPKERAGKLVFDEFENVVEVRSLTINFEGNSGFKICGIHLKDPQGQTYQVKTPTLVSGSVSASSILEPRSAYDPIYLFDSRFEYGWASNQKAKDVSLSFGFDRPQRIESIRIWNGYQRSITHCYSNSRVKTIKVSGDGGYSAAISVRDILGSQLIKLPKPFEGRQLKFEVVDSFPGKTYQDLVISEIRFHDGKNWFMLDPTRELKNGIVFNRQQFAKAGVAKLLNDSYTAEKSSAATPPTTSQEPGPETYGSYVNTTLRLRADGGFYLSGNFDNEKDGVARYFSLGNYEVKEASATAGLKLRLFGLYYETQEYGDCNGCGRDCNKASTEDGATEQKIFQEIFTLKPTQDGRYELVNQSGGKKIKFDKLTLEREKREVGP